MEKRPLRASLLSDLSLIFVAVIWGSGFIASQMAIDAKMNSSLIMALRFTIATLVLLVAFSKDLKQFKKEELKGGIIAGTLLFLAFFTQTLGLVYTTPANNAFLTATNVVMVPFIAWILTAKRPPVKVFFAAFLCFLGIGLLTFSFESGFVFNRGDLLTLICAVFFACHIAYLGISAKKIDTKKLTFLQMAVAAVLSIITFLMVGMGSLETVNLKDGLLPVIYLGVFSTCIAFFIQTHAQKRTSSTKAVIFLSTEALFGSLFSVLLGYEQIRMSLVLGGIIVLISVLMLEVKVNKK